MWEKYPIPNSFHFLSRLYWLIAIYTEWNSCNISLDMWASFNDQSFLVRKDRSYFPVLPSQCNFRKGNCLVNNKQYIANQVLLDSWYHFFLLLLLEATEFKSYIYIYIYIYICMYVYTISGLGKWTLLLNCNCQFLFSFLLLNIEQKWWQATKY